MTIFDNLIKNENTFTEAFKNYMKFDPFRESFINLIDLDIPKDEISFNNFSTQVTTDHGRPDLAISTKSIELYIEIKVWDTKLTENQPSGYLKELGKSEKKNKGLILLIPEGYGYEDNYEKRKKECNSSIKTQTITWSVFLKKLISINSENPIIKEFITLLKEWFEPKPIIINDKFKIVMNNPEIPKSLESLISLIDQVKYELQARKVEITFSNKGILDEYGIYFNKEGEFSFYFGLWFDHWKKKGEPLILSLQEHTDRKDRIETFENAITEFGFSKSEYLENENQHVSDIPLITTNDDYDVKELVNKIHQIIKKLK
jgi:hypothetical protein